MGSQVCSPDFIYDLGMELSLPDKQLYLVVHLVGHLVVVEAFYSYDSFHYTMRHL